MRVMPVKSSLLAQLSSLRITLLVTYLPALVGLLYIGLQDQIPVKELTKDANQVIHTGVYAGAVSNIGILFWCATASLCLFTCLVLRHRSAPTGLRRFLLWAALLTFVLMLDDLFLLHDVIIPNTWGVTEALPQAVYGLATAIVLFASRRVILDHTEYLPLGLALIFFASSIAFDASEISYRLQGIPDNLTFWLEDGGKSLGIISWFAYYARVCYVQLRGA
jgi:hypothetical protein